MLKNLKLGVKLFIGFGSILAISLFIGAMAIINMARVNVQSKQLSHEYVPEVQVANEIERNSLLTMYNIRGYNYTAEEKFLNEGLKYLAIVQDEIENAKKLANESANLIKLNEAVEKVDIAVNEYEAEVKETVTLNKAMNELEISMNQAANLFVENCNAYLQSQNQSFSAEIASGKKGSDLTSRLKKINTITEVIEFGDNIRIAFWKSQAQRTPETYKSVLNQFEKINEKIEELMPLTKQAVNINQLNLVKKNAESYKEYSQAVIEDWLKLEELNLKRVETGHKVLAEAQATAKAGIDNTTKISEHATSLLNTSSRAMVIGLCVALIIGLFLAIVMTRIITGPLFKGVTFAQQVADGNLDATIDVDQKDEIGQLAKALQYMVEKLRNVVGEVISAVENVNSGSQQLSASAQQMSQGASEQASAAEEASSSMEQMSSNIQANADNAQQTEKIALKASQDADESGKAVSSAVSAMTEIASKISIIVEIARQTDLLALNAAIEAARAGEHGKGFAVVADGVRKLAERSQQTAAEISTLAGSSVEVAQRAGDMLKQLVPDIKRTADLVQEINAASTEQNEGALQINKAIQQLDEVIQQNASVSEEMSSTSEELASQAEQLQSTIEYFKISGMQKKAVRQQVHQVHQVQQVSHIKNLSGGTNGSKPKNNKKGVHIKLEHAAPVNDTKDSEFEKF
ncbi:MAG TPA: methyl-accepting chemotaxis protein [bacterium]|nr:methyl-accepting chemotaxis protein [bacterium]HPN43963.1 methyl-accepting chemotaxis protein [bacterium]